MKPESQRLINACMLLIGQGQVNSLASLSDLAFGHKNYFTALKRQGTSPSQVMINYLVENFNLNVNYIKTGQGSMFNNNDGATQTDNTIINPTKTQEMDPLTMDYINTLKEQLVKKDEQIKALLRQLDSKGDDEVLSRKVGAIKEGQDELTENL